MPSATTVHFITCWSICFFYSATHNWNSLCPSRTADGWSCQQHLP